MVQSPTRFIKKIVVKAEDVPILMNHLEEAMGWLRDNKPVQAFQRLREGVEILRKAIRS